MHLLRHYALRLSRKLLTQRHSVKVQDSRIISNTDVTTLNLANTLPLENNVPGLIIIFLRAAQLQKLRHFRHAVFVCLSVCLSV